MTQFLNCPFSGHLIQKAGPTNCGAIPYHYPLRRGYRWQPFYRSTLCKVNFKHGSRDGKHDDVTSRNESLKLTLAQILYEIRIMSEKILV